MDESHDLLKNIDSLPIAIKKFMKLEYIISYEESKNNEKEIDEQKYKNNLILSNNVSGQANQTKKESQSIKPELISLEKASEEAKKYFRDDEWEDMEYNYGDEEEIYDQIQKEINKNIESDILDDIRNGNFDNNIEYFANQDEFEGDDLEEYYKEKEEELIDKMKEVNEEYDNFD